MRIRKLTYFEFNSYKTKLILGFGFIFLSLISCQKNLDLSFSSTEIKQVIIANLRPDNFLSVNISKSKQPDDYSSIEFLNNCQVALYEDSIYKEQLYFVLRDSLSGLGYYVSSFQLKENKTYKIISTNAELKTIEASEYLPNIPLVTSHQLLQHADAQHPNMEGSYTISFNDDADKADYYFIATFYQVLKPVVKNNGDTIYKYDYFSVPSYAADLPNLSNNYRTYFTDEHFNGSNKNFTIHFPSQYNDTYKAIYLYVELSKCGKNFYDWFTQQLSYGTDYFNDGQSDRLNLVGNIKNGYGHFTANSSYYFYFNIK